MALPSAPDRRYFIGGSDARIIMGDDEAASYGSGGICAVRSSGEASPTWRSDQGPESALVRGHHRSDAHWLARRGCLLRDRCHFSGVVALELSSAPASVPHQE